MKRENEEFYHMRVLSHETQPSRLTNSAMKLCTDTMEKLVAPFRRLTQPFVALSAIYVASVSATCRWNSDFYENGQSTPATSGPTWKARIFNKNQPASVPLLLAAGPPPLPSPFPPPGLRSSPVQASARRFCPDRRPLLRSSLLSASAASLHSRSWWRPRWTRPPERAPAWLGCAAILLGVPERELERSKCHGFRASARLRLPVIPTS